MLVVLKIIIFRVILIVCVGVQIIVVCVIFIRSDEKAGNYHIVGWGDGEVGASDHQCGGRDGLFIAWSFHLRALHIFVQRFSGRHVKAVKFVFALLCLLYCLPAISEKCSAKQKKNNCNILLSEACSKNDRFISSSLSTILYKASSLNLLLSI